MEELITPLQVSELERLFEGWPTIRARMMESLRLSSIADMPQSRYCTVVERIIHIKMLRRELEGSGLAHLLPPK